MEFFTDEKCSQVIVVDMLRRVWMHKQIHKQSKENSYWFLSFSLVSVLIRDLGMIPYIKIFLNDEQFRSPALCILEQLSEMNPEEYMSTAIGALCSSTETELRLKMDLLKVCLFFLRLFPPFHLC